jgi:hypothetical protein
MAGGKYRGVCWRWKHDSSVEVSERLVNSWYFFLWHQCSHLGASKVDNVSSSVLYLCHCSETKIFLALSCTFHYSRYFLVCYIREFVKVELSNPVDYIHTISKVLSLYLCVSSGR